MTPSRILAVFALLAWLSVAHAAPTLLAVDGAARLPVVTSPGASAETKARATQLADYLGKISGAKFAMESGDGSTGLAVGPATDFPALRLGVEFVANDPAHREEYLIRSHAQGLWLVGASELAV